MKKTINKGLKTLILCILFILSTTSAAFANTTFGNLDSIADGTITGWAINSAAQESHAPISVVITNQMTSEVVEELTTTASTVHSGLTTLGYADDNHGFTVKMDWSDVPDGNYLIQAYSNGQILSNPMTYVKGDLAKNAIGSGNLIPLGVFRTTAYCPCYSCSEGWGRKTCTGALAVSGHTVAVDPRVIPLGSKLMIGGIVYTAEDRGGAVKGNHIDIYFNTHAETRLHGTQSEEVYLVQ